MVIGEGQPSINNQLTNAEKAGEYFLNYTIPYNTADIQITGWAGFTTKLETFGYSIDGAPAVWVDGSSGEPMPGVTADNEGGANARMYDLTLPTAKLAAGTHTLKIFAKLENGSEICFYTFTYSVP